MTKPRTAEGYERRQVARVRETCLYLATKLGDLMDELVVVGGFVPTLLVDQSATSEPHVGTLDLDIGMTLGMLTEHRYEELAERLRDAGFGPDHNARGNVVHQRWHIDGSPKVTLDFLIPPSHPSDKGGKLRHLQSDFAAIVAPGLELAFVDRVQIRLAGSTIRGEQAGRDIWVCGAGAFVAMKALSLRNRGANKDAYDLVYLARNHAGGVVHLADRFAVLRSSPEAQQALRYLDEDFQTIDSIGPMRVAEFVTGGRDDELQADAWATMRELIDAVGP